MDSIQISKMNISDLEEIKDVLLSDFDDFWNVNTFKEELLNPNSKYIMAKIHNKIIGFAGIWKSDRSTSLISSKSVMSILEI